MKHNAINEYRPDSQHFLEINEAAKPRIIVRYFIEWRVDDRDAADAIKLDTLTVSSSIQVFVGARQ